MRNSDSNSNNPIRKRLNYIAFILILCSIGRVVLFIIAGK